MEGLADVLSYPAQNAGSQQATVVHSCHAFIILGCPCNHMNMRFYYFHILSFTAF